MGRKRRTPIGGDAGTDSTAPGTAGDIGDDNDGVENGKSDGGVVNLATVAGVGNSAASDNGGDGGDGGADGSRPKRKYTRRADKAKETVDLTGFIAENLYSAHLFLAALTNKDIFKLEKSEADELGKSIQGVARHYDIPGVDQKTVDWLRLARTLGMVYGARLFAARAAMSATKSSSAPNAPRSAPIAVPQTPTINPDAAPRSEPPSTRTTVRVTPVPGMPSVEIEQ